MENNMTWRQLAEILSQIPQDRLDDNVTVFACGEFFPVMTMEKTENYGDEGDGILDKGHCYLLVND